MTTTASNHGKLALQYCGERLPLRVLQSVAGFYIGTCTEDGHPVSRESADYYDTMDNALAALLHGTWRQRLHP